METSTRDRSVCVLIGRWSEPLARALAGQLRPQDGVVEHGGLIREGLRKTAERSPDWIWVLDGNSIPRAGALDALLDAATRVDRLPDALALASVVVDRNGRADRGHAAWYRRDATETAMRAAELRLLPIRAAAGPIMFDRRAAEAITPPRRSLQATGAVLEWSACVLRSRVGYLVPDSECELVGAGSDPLRNPIVAARLVGGRAFIGIDRVRVVFDAIERVGERVRS